MTLALAAHERAVVLRLWLNRSSSSHWRTTLRILAVSVQSSGRLYHPDPLGAGCSGPSSFPDTGNPASFLTATHCSIQLYSHDTLTPAPTMGRSKDLDSADLDVLWWRVVSWMKPPQLDSLCSPTLSCITVWICATSEFLHLQYNMSNKWTHMIRVMSVCWLSAAVRWSVSTSLTVRGRACLVTFLPASWISACRMILRLWKHCSAPSNCKMNHANLTAWTMEDALVAADPSSAIDLRYCQSWPSWSG